MKRALAAFLFALLVALPVLADDPPATPDGLENRIFPDQPEVPIFLWNDVDGATDYDLVILDQSDVSYDFVNLLEGDHCVPTLQCAYQQPTPIPPGVYTWQIRAHNATGYSEYSAPVTLYVSRFTVPGFEPVASPTPIPSATPIPDADVQVDSNGLIQTLATAEGALSTAPNLSSAEISDFSLNQNATTIFGYAKWLLSSQSAEEIFGPFSVFILTVGIAISGLLIIASAYVLFLVAIRLIRLVVWVILSIRKLLPF